MSTIKAEGLIATPPAAHFLLDPTLHEAVTVPHALESVISRGCTAVKKERYPSATEFLAAFEAVEEQVR